MKYKISVIFLAFINALSLSGQKAEPQVTNLVQYVNPNIGSAHSRYFFYTPAALPFGMAKLAPSTYGSYGNKSGWEATGYDDRHTSIEGFAHFHEFQIGGIVYAPTVGKIKTYPGSLDKPNSGYRSTFDKKDEFATAGYYRVWLKDYNIKAELTATERVGFQRYTFPASNESNIIFNIGHQMGESGAVLNSQVTYDDNHIWGYVTTEPVYVNKYQKGANVTMYFYATLDKKPTAYGTFLDSVQYADKKTIEGKGAGLYLTFKTKQNEIINIKTGLSYTSVENAKINLMYEATNISFSQAQQKATTIWNKALGRITVEGKKKADKIKFYTGLFHAILGRGLASDINGAYPKNDGTIGQIPLTKNGVPMHHHYNTDGIWGGQWNLIQLWSIAYPDYYNDWIQSQLLVYKDAGWLGDGIANSRYVSGVGTNFVGLAIAAGYNVGIKNYDIELAYQAARKNELESSGRVYGAGKLDVGVFVERGYSPYIVAEIDPELNTAGSPFGASHTLEYSYSSYAVAQFAKALNKTEDYKILEKLSNGWKLLYDSNTKFIRARNLEGKFLDKFNPFESWVGFQEGNACQYTFYVPHAPEQLVNLLGKENFVHRLDSIFIISQKNVFGGGKDVYAFAGIEALYNHGNQPNLHISWLFNFAARPDLTQKWVRAICNQFYGTDGIHGYGYGQDEDQGQLGAWFVLAGMGLFDVKGLTAPDPSFQLVAPLFDKVTIKLPDSIRKNKFVIQVLNQGDDKPYIQNIKLNGVVQSKLKLNFADLKKGGEMQIMVGNKAKL